MCCDECLKTQEQMELLSRIQIQQDDIGSEEATDDELIAVTDSYPDQVEEKSSDSPFDVTQSMQKDIKCQSSRTRLRLLKGITIVEQKGTIDINTRRYIYIYPIFSGGRLCNSLSLMISLSKFRII